MRNQLILIFLLLLLGGCGVQEGQNAESVKPQGQRPVAIDNGKFFEVRGQKMLYGGTDSSQHFNISNLNLKPTQFHYGIGREAFPALLEPEFIPVNVADAFWQDDDRFLVAEIGNEVKAYAIKDLIRHEVVNDVINGVPVMAAYCILADLGAVYKRTYGSDTLTFALSGYTYYDSTVWHGLDGFVLWDRETESLWWPLIGKAVSGPLKNVPLIELEKLYWQDTNWKYIKTHMPQTMVLKSGQDFERPLEWTKIANIDAILLLFDIEN